MPTSAKNFRVTELELTGLLVNIHGFMQLLHNQYFAVLVDHKAIEYMVKSKTETLTTRLKTMLLKLSKYTTDLKYQKGSEMHTSNALSRLHNLTDTLIKMKLKCQLQTHALHDLDKPIKIPKMKLFPGI